MIYHTLANFYDALVKDDEATRQWTAFISSRIHGKKLAELACGSGEITLSLAHLGYQMDASDLSCDMIQKAKEKDVQKLVNWRVLDMLSFQENNCYDGVLCLCDSINYILKKEQLKQLFQQVYESLMEGGIFLFDMHSLDRLEEFKEEFFEDGIIDGHGYQWSINSEDDLIYQDFAFYDADGNAQLEQHMQRVYEPKEIEKQLMETGFYVTIYTDFDSSGICAGEKYFYVCRKEQV